MANKGAPGCPVEGCDGDLYREFVTGLNRSTAQMMRWGGLALLFGPPVLGAPFYLEYLLRGSPGVGGILGLAVALAVPMIAGFVLLRKRQQGLSKRSEQQRCNKCGKVVLL